MKPHPASDIFPLMDEEGLARLADDVREHGLLEPIVVLDEMVLDGRNRLRACELAEVTPRFEEWQSDGLTPVEWVVAKNLHRRHLTHAQRAAIAVDLLPQLEAEAKERQREHKGTAPGRSADTPSAIRGSEHFDNSATWRKSGAYDGEATAKAAELVGLGRSTVAAAKAIAKRSPETLEQMRDGKIPTVAQAARHAGYPALAQGSGDSGRPIEEGIPSIHYGKGDKWHESTQPLVRYLVGWRNRDFKFRHINPTEARRRIKVIDQLLTDLQTARNDLLSRSQIAKLKV